jgi:hypothetical protein
VTPVAAEVHNGNLAAIALKVVDQCSQVVAHELFRQGLWYAIAVPVTVIA